MTAAEVKSRAPASPVAIALVVAAAFFMQGLDAAIINTSLPQMAKTLHVGAVDMNTGVTAYILAVAILTPLSGWLADRFGARTVFASAVALFTLASVGCGAANTLPEFVAARILQGVGGALVIPVGRIVILRSAKPAEIMQATALISWPALFAPVVGPVIGGAITTFFGWRWNFLLNLPLGIAGIALVLAIIPDLRETTRRPLDVVGAVISAASLFLLIYGLESLGHGGFTVRPIAALAVGALCGVASVTWFRRRTHPLLNLAPVRIPTFAITSVGAGSLFIAAMSATPFMLPLMMQTVWGYDPLRTGWWLLVYFLGNLLMKSVTTWVLRRWGFRRVMVVTGLGIALTVAACGLLDPTTAPLLVGSVFFAAGATRSMQFTAINTLAYADVPADLRASAATLSSMMQQLSMAVGIAFAAVLLNLARNGGSDHLIGQSDFRLAFLVCGMVAAGAAALCLRLPARAGAAVSGHQT